MTTLLIVDDEPTSGAHCEVAASAPVHGRRGGEGRRSPGSDGRTPRAIAVCDVGLPDRNGLWLAGQMRRQFPKTALVITTGFGIAALPLNLDAAAIGYLPKPFTEQQLLRTLDWAIEWRREKACLSSNNQMRTH